MKYVWGSNLLSLKPSFLTHTNFFFKKVFSQSLPFTSNKKENTCPQNANQHCKHVELQVTYQQNYIHDAWARHSTITLNDFGKQKPWSITILICLSVTIIISRLILLDPRAHFFMIVDSFFSSQLMVSYIHQMDGKL